MLFRETIEGHFIHGKSPNAMYLKNTSGYHTLDPSLTEKCSSGKTAKARIDHVTIPDLGAGEWVINNENWQGQLSEKGLKFLTDGCHFRLDSAKNQRNDGNGYFYWKNNRMILRFEKTKKDIEFQYGRINGEAVWYTRSLAKGHRYFLKNLSGY